LQVARLKIAALDSYSKKFVWRKTTNILINKYGCQENASKNISVICPLLNNSFVIKIFSIKRRKYYDNKRTS